MLSGRVLGVSEDVMLAWRILVDEGRRRNHTFSQPDLIIGATALHHGMILVTRDTGDFQALPIDVFNPWDQA